MRDTDTQNLGADWIAESLAGLTLSIDRVKPSAYNEANRYLPPSVTSIPGYIRYDVNPFMREIVDCFDVDSPVREVNLKKGVQITYSTALESGALYFMGHVKTLPIMYITADAELAKARIENNFLPMLNESGMGDIIRSSDEGNTRKTGKTANHLQFEGGGYLVPFGAINANKMRSFSIAVMLKDEIDGWPDTVGKDGDPDTLSDARCSGYWERRKIFRGSTPLIKGTSKIEKAYLRGDQRKYMVPCKHCGHSQALRWHTHDNETGVTGGFAWDMDGDELLTDTVRYLCQKCGGAHYEFDKEKLFSEAHGAHWAPTAQPAERGIRSYHLPALYSPIGMQPWYKCVSDYLQAYDPVERKVKDVAKFQVFYNNILAEPFEVQGTKVRFTQVSAHRRGEYRLGQVPNDFAEQYSGSRILFLTMTVDVHKEFLGVAVLGWTQDAKSYVIEYKNITGDDCSQLSDPAWGKLQEMIEETEWSADDGATYRPLITLIDAGYANDTVTRFCSAYSYAVYPILGRDRAAKNQTIKEFAEFKTQDGTIGFRILVDHYKDRLAPVLRREWSKEDGAQKPYHFNAPVDIEDKQLKELTVETRRKKDDGRGGVSYYWHRPNNARNELWDLLVYGHAAVEIFALTLCRDGFGLETIDWPQFWQYANEHPGQFGRDLTRRAT